MRDGARDLNGRMERATHHSDEKHEVGERFAVRLCELVVNGDRDGSAETERQTDAADGDGD